MNAEGAPRRPLGPQLSLLVPVCAGQIVELGAFGLQSEVEQLKRDKLLLLKEVMRLRNQQLETAGERDARGTIIARCQDPNQNPLRSRPFSGKSPRGTLGRAIGCRPAAVCWGRLARIRSFSDPDSPSLHFWPYRADELQHVSQRLQQAETVQTQILQFLQQHVSPTLLDSSALILNTRKRCARPPLPTR